MESESDREKESKSVMFISFPVSQAALALWIIEAQNKVKV